MPKYSVFEEVRKDWTLSMKIRDWFVGVQVWWIIGVWEGRELLGKVKGKGKAKFYIIPCYYDGDILEGYNQVWDIFYML